MTQTCGRFDALDFVTGEHARVVPPRFLQVPRSRRCYTSLCKCIESLGKILHKATATLDFNAADMRTDVEEG